MNHVITLRNLVFIIVIAGISVSTGCRRYEGKSAPNESSAISSLRTLSSVQAQYVTRYDTYADLATLCNACLIDSVLGAGTKSGYRFTLTFANNSCWQCIARPVRWGENGEERNFIIETDGVIKYGVEKDSDEYPNIVGGS
jgi:hypothetical protein